MTTAVELVPVADWVARATALRAAGYVFVDFLSAQDESVDGEIRTRVVVRVRRDGDWAAVTVATDIADALPSLQHVYPGIAWHEREAAESLGLALIAPDGATVDARPLLGVRGAPMRKSVLLAARQDKEWPGAADPGSNRRRQRPIGVPDARDQRERSQRGGAR